jgi:inhibitor of lysozyme (Ivy)
MQRQLRWVVVTIGLVSTWAVRSPAMAAEPYMFDVIKKPAYARALKSLLDAAGNLPSWTHEAVKAKGNIVESPAIHATIDGITYDVFSNCQPHNCDSSQLAVMFAPNGTQAWGALDQEGTVSYLGAPSNAQQVVLKEALK